jgi:hypothetical protein
VRDDAFSGFAFLLVIPRFARNDKARKAKASNVGDYEIMANAQFQVDV